MVLEPGTAGPAPADGVEVARVDDAAGLDEFVQVIDRRWRCQRISRSR